MVQAASTPEDPDPQEGAWNFDFGLREVVVRHPDQAFLTRSGRPVTIRMKKTTFEKTRECAGATGYPVIEVAAYDGADCLVGRATLEQHGPGTIHPHGVIEPDWRRDGLSRLFFDLASRYAQAAGCSLAAPNTLSSDGSKAWRGRNYLRGSRPRGELEVSLQTECTASPGM